MTSLELLEACKENLDRVNLPTEEDTRIKSWINQVQREDLCNVHSFDWMERIYTVPCQASISFYAVQKQDQHKDILWVKFRSDPANEFIEMTEANHRALTQRLSSMSEGTPTAWTRFWDEDELKKGFEVRRIPENGSDEGWEFQLLVTEYPKNFLYTEDEENLLTRDFSKAVETLVTARGFLFYGQVETAMALQNNVNIEVSKLLQGERSRDKQANMTFRMSPAAGRPATGLRKRLRNLGGPAYGWLRS